MLQAVDEDAGMAGFGDDEDFGRCGTPKMRSANTSTPITDWMAKVHVAPPA